MRRHFPIAACTPPDATRLETASTGCRGPYSHSIINEPSKLLMCKEQDAASQIFTVTFTVNLSGTSIGAGLRAVRLKLTLRDLSTSIDSRDDCQRHRHACMSVGEASKPRRHQTP